MKHAIIFLLILLAASAAADDSRNRGYGFLMAEEPVGPRNVAMGSAGAALPGSGFRYYNPAQPFFSAYAYANAEFGQMPGEVNRGGFESVMVFPEWFTAISFHTSSVDFETRDERGFGSAASSSTTFGALSLGYIRDNLALAASINMADDRIWVSSNYSAVSFSAGLGYKALDGKLNLGAAWLNGAAWSRGFGDGKDTSAWHDGRVPVFARAGAAWSDAIGPLPYTVTADIAYRDEDGTFSMPVGAEVRVLPYISLRVGKRIGWESEIISLGIGFNLDRISFDAAFVPSVFVDDYEIKWNMGFTYSMGGKRRPAMEPAKPVESPEPIKSNDTEVSTDSTESTESNEPDDSGESGDTTTSPEESSVDTEGANDESTEPSEPIDPSISPESTKPEVSIDPEGSTELEESSTKLPVDSDSSTNGEGGATAE